MTVTVQGLSFLRVVILLSRLNPWLPTNQLPYNLLRSLNIQVGITQSGNPDNPKPPISPIMPLNGCSSREPIKMVAILLPSLLIPKKDPPLPAPPDATPHLPNKKKSKMPDPSDVS